jgi:hypothetical protein
MKKHLEYPCPLLILQLSRLPPLTKILNETLTIMQEIVLSKYLKNHKVEEAVDALQSLRLSRKTMCSLLITKTLGKSGDYINPHRCNIVS